MTESNLDEGVNLTLFPGQECAWRAQKRAVLFEGDKGSGKTHLIQTAALRWAYTIPETQVYLFTRFSKDIAKYLERYSILLQPWFDAGICRIVDYINIIRFKNGSSIFLSHCNEEHQVNRYGSAEMSALLIDDLPQWSEYMYKRLQLRIRHKHTLPGIICTATTGEVPEWVHKEWAIDEVISPVSKYLTESSAA